MVRVLLWTCLRKCLLCGMFAELSGGSSVMGGDVWRGVFGGARVAAKVFYEGNVHSCWSDKIGYIVYDVVAHTFAV